MRKLTFFLRLLPFYSYCLNSFLFFFFFIQFLLFFIWLLVTIHTSIMSYSYTIHEYIFIRKKLKWIVKRQKKKINRSHSYSKCGDWKSCFVIYFYFLPVSVDIAFEWVTKQILNLIHSFQVLYSFDPSARNEYFILFFLLSYRCCFPFSLVKYWSLFKFVHFLHFFFTSDNSFLPRIEIVFHHSFLFSGYLLTKTTAFSYIFSQQSWIWHIIRVCQ